MTQCFLDVARHLLEVVENHQTLAAPRDGTPDLGHRVVLAQRQVEPLGHGIDDAVQTSRLRQIAEPDAAWELPERTPPEPGDQPRLAAAADTQDRDEAHTGVQASRQLGQRLTAAHEGIALGWQAVRIERRQRREVGTQVRRDNL